MCKVRDMAFSNSTMVEKEVVSTEVVKFNLGKLSLLLCWNSLNIPLVNLKHVKMFTKMKSRNPLELPNSNGTNYKGMQFGYFKLTSSKDFLGVTILVKPFLFVIFQWWVIVGIQVFFWELRHFKKFTQHGIW